MLSEDPELAIVICHYIFFLDDSLTLRAIILGWAALVILMAPVQVVFALRVHDEWVTSHFYYV